MIRFRLVCFISSITLYLSSGVAWAEDIGVVLAGTRSVYWQQMSEGATRAGIDFGVSVLVRSPPDDDLQSRQEDLQLKMLQSMLEYGVKSIILAPMPLHETKGLFALPVPVLFVDRKSLDFNAVSLVETDNFAAGQAAAETLRGRLQKGAQIGVFRVAPDITSLTERENGFIFEARKMSFDVVVESYIGIGIRHAQDRVTAVLGKGGASLDAVFAPHDFSTSAVLRAVETLPRNKRPLVVGFDYWPSFEVSLRNGDLYALIVQQPFKMGYLAVQRAVELSAGKNIPRLETIDVHAITADNLDTPSIRAELALYKK
jgi:ribose transport system substrate-binding protein